MTIDERLDFIATLQRTHDEQIGKLVEQNALVSERMEVLTERTIQAMDAINRLARIAESHERRIEDLEDRRPS
jgi:hypothetical protein